MRIAIVGCGFVADYYMRTLPNHPHLELLGVADKVYARAQKFAAYFDTVAYHHLDELLTDPRVEMVINLTNPRNHYEVTKAALAASKHVYSEKPLAMAIDQARELVVEAERRGLRLASAPCSLLGETAQSVWRALRRNKLGKVRLVYAEMDEGMVYGMPYRAWASESGTPWPYKDEFEVGTTLEHAGYIVPWLCAMFGPAVTVHAYSACLMPDKVPGEQLDPANAPDFAMGVITFKSGVVARLTCSLLAPHDHGLTIVGDTGVLHVEDTWFYNAPITIQRAINIKRRHLKLPWKEKVRLVGGKGMVYQKRGAQQMDFFRGPAELADAIREKRPARLSARFSLHINELVLAISQAGLQQGVYRMTTTFDPVEPMPWAK